MAKLDNQPIDKQDIINYLESDSDFSFELEILNTALASEYRFSHGGTYEDPVTGISRQYDIRGIATRDRCEIRFAIECKNLRENFPLAVLRVPRNLSESVHYLWLKRDTSEPVETYGVPHYSKSSVEPLKCSPSRYYELIGQVGKACSQVGRKEHNGEITGNDSEVYEKWSQAISSAHRLLADFRSGSTQSNCLMVLPILVVPDKRLWIADYDQQGRLMEEPSQVDCCSYFLNKSYSFMSGVEHIDYTISHLEIMTKTGLQNFLHELKTDEGMWQAFFHN